MTRILAVLFICGMTSSQAVVQANPPAAEKSDRILRKEVNVRGTPEAVFKLWTTSDGVAKFFSKDSNIDLKLDGPYEMYFDKTKPDAHGKRGSEGCKILSFVPNEMLAFDWNFPPAVSTLRESGAKTQVILRFQRLGRNRVKVILTQHGWGEGKDWDAGYAYFDKAWSAVLDQLKNYLKKNDKTSAKKSSRESKTESDTGKKDGILRHEGIVEAPVDQVWAAMTTKEGLESWMVAHASTDLRVGGKMLSRYDAKGVLGDDGTIENTYLCFEPGRMLSIKATKSPASFPFKNAINSMWTVMWFDPQGPRQTKVTICCMGFTEDEESQNMRKHFDWGNAWTLKKLQEKFSPSPSTAASE